VSRLNPDLGAMSRVAGFALIVDPAKRPLGGPVASQAHWQAA
jgi:hypothetical protein